MQKRGYCCGVSEKLLDIRVFKLKTSPLGITSDDTLLILSWSDGLALYTPLFFMVLL